MDGWTLTAHGHTAIFDDGKSLKIQKNKTKKSGKIQNLTALGASISSYLVLPDK